MFWKVLLLVLPVIFSYGYAQDPLNDATQMVVKREGKSDSDCKQACQAETLLKCKFYMYLESAKVCLLSSSDHPSVANQAKVLGIDQPSVEKYLKEKRELMRNEMGQLESLRTQLTDLEHKVQNFQKMKSDMEKTLQDIEVKNIGTSNDKHVFISMSNKMHKLMQLNIILQNQISKLAKQHALNVRDLRILRQSKKKSDIELEQMNNNIDKLQSFIGSVQKEDDANKNELDRIRDRQDQINEWMRQLKRKVHSAHTELKNNPLIMRILNNQKTIADSLQEMDRKMNAFDNKQMKSDEIYDELYGRVIANEGERKSLANNINSVQKRVKSLQDDVKRIENPQSSDNMEKMRTMTTLKNDVTYLKRSNEELEKNLKRSHTELQGLIKDIVNVKLSDQSNKAGITAVALAHRHTQQVFDNMRKDQSSVLNKVHVLEDVYKRILEVVHNIEVHQVQLKQEISHFDDSIRRVAHDLNNKLQESNGNTIKNQASVLGAALDKLTAESEASLQSNALSAPVEEDVLAPIKKELELLAPNSNQEQLLKNEEQILKNEGTILETNRDAQKLLKKKQAKGMNPVKGKNEEEIVVANKNPESLPFPKDEKEIEEDINILLAKQNKTTLDALKTKMQQVIDMKTKLNYISPTPSTDILTKRIQQVQNDISKEIKQPYSDEQKVKELAKEKAEPLKAHSKILKKELEKRKEQSNATPSPTTVKPSVKTTVKPVVTNPVAPKPGGGSTGSPV